MPPYNLQRFPICLVVFGAQELLPTSPPCHKHRWIWKPLATHLSLSILQTFTIAPQSFCFNSQGFNYFHFCLLATRKCLAALNGIADRVFWQLQFTSSHLPEGAKNFPPQGLPIPSGLTAGSASWGWGSEGLSSSAINQRYGFGKTVPTLCVSVPSSVKWG